MYCFASLKNARLKRKGGKEKRGGEEALGRGGQAMARHTRLLRH